MRNLLTDRVAGELRELDGDSWPRVGAQLGNLLILGLAKGQRPRAGCGSRSAAQPRRPSSVSAGRSGGLESLPVGENKPRPRRDVAVLADGGFDLCQDSGRSRRALDREGSIDSREPLPVATRGT